MNKKILVSLSVIGAVAAIAVGGTIAYFSDTETSTGNTFTAGAIDLTVDSEQHYNGNVCAVGTDDVNENENYEEYVWLGSADYPAEGTPCDGTWGATDLGAEHQFFNFGDVKPGDEGENTISLHVNNNDAWVRLLIKGMTDNDNTLTEPEAADANEVDDLVSGELRENLLFSMWLDQGVTPGFGSVDGATGGMVPDRGEGDNIRQEQYEPELISDGTIDEDTDNDGINETWTLPFPLLGGQTAYFGVNWNLPLTTGNEVQTDSMSATMEFQVVQYRNNPTQQF